MRIHRHIAVSLLLLFVPVALATGPAAAVPDGIPNDEIPAGHIVVSGRIFYIDRQSDRSHEAAGLRVEIWDMDFRSFSTGEKLDETVTDADGFFQSKPILNVDPDGPSGQPEGTQDVYIKLFTNNGTVRLLQAGTAREFGWNSYHIDERDGLMRNVPDGHVAMKPLYIMENTPDVEALWTFVNLVDGWQYMLDRTGEDPGPVTAYWAKNSQDGPRYDPETRTLHFRDADAGYGDVVLQHEAYAFLHTAYDALPSEWLGCLSGPSANLRESTDPACALAGGFATFFPLAVQADPTFASLGTRAIDLDAASIGSPGWQDGDTVPGRIAGAFWDLHEGDETEEFYDVYNATFEDIWDVFSESHPTTMEEWWEGWKDLGKNSCEALGSLYQNTIDYNTPPTALPVSITLDEDTTAVVDLGDYVTDAECPNESLTYTLTDAGNPEAGIVLVPTSVISVTPAANWFGQTQIQVSVSDGPATLNMTIPVTVVPINDPPEVSPRVSDVEVRYGETITLHLLPHGRDVEDPPYLLTWDVELEAGDEPYITVQGRGSTTLSFQLDPTVRERRSIRAVLVVRDTEGATGRQAVVLTWTERPNSPPHIVWERFHREYTATKNHKILVDLSGVAVDAEDDPALLAWYAKDVDHAQVGGEGTQRLEFDPDVDFIGSDVVILEVRDLQGATASGTITLTWQDPLVVNNQPPRILRNRLVGTTVGKNSPACFSLGDKATDPDDPVQSLKWFIADYLLSDLRVDGQGTQRLCLISRPNFEGCQVAKFVVRDPKGAEDSHEVRICWRTIVEYLPNVQNRRR